MLPYVVEFVRFSTGFVVIIAVALLTLRYTDMILFYMGL